MNASKENCREAVKAVAMIKKDGTMKVQQEMFLLEFLAAAEKRLPSNDAIERDKQRKRRYKKNTSDQVVKQASDINKEAAALPLEVAKKLFEADTNTPYGDNPQSPAFHGN